VKYLRRLTRHCRIQACFHSWHDGTVVAIGVSMSRDYIDFISAYCDRWCERCAFTSRCSAYAVDIATEMCGGDFAAGLELAVGQPPEAAGSAPVERSWDLPEEEPSEAERERFVREEEAREDRIDESPITTMATAALLLARGWLEEHRDRAMAGADAPLREALETVGWDAYLIPTKLHRALRGRDASRRGERFGDDHPVQNDWNGSAKVALISIERSRDAWEVIAKATGDPDARQQTDRLADLRDAVDLEFPKARQFVRPGFDDGGRRRWKWF